MRLTRDIEGIAANGFEEPTLNSIKLSGIICGVRVPDNSTVFEDRPDQGTKINLEDK